MAFVLTAALLLTGMTIGIVAVDGPDGVAETLERVGIEHHAIDATVERFHAGEMNRSATSVDNDSTANDVEPGAEIERGPAAFDVEHTERLVETEVNELRADHGLENLSYHRALHVAALNHSEYMREESFIGHEWPDGTTPQDRADRAGADCQAGENVARTWFDRPVETGMGTERYEDEDALAEALARHWAASDGHYQNMISPNYTQHAVGIVVTDDGAVWVTHKFCT